MANEIFIKHFPSIMFIYIPNKLPYKLRLGLNRFS